MVELRTTVLKVVELRTTVLKVVELMTVVLLNFSENLTSSLRLQAF